MRWVGSLVFGATLVLALARPVLAAGPPKPPSGDPTVSELEVIASKTVSELTVTAKAKCLTPQAGGMHPTRPKVVDVYPARGAVVRPGLLVVRVTFDQPMACEGAFEATPPLRNPCPGLLREMLLSLDRRTVRTVCVVEPGAQYGFALGQDPNAPTFIGLAGLPTQSAKVAFSTSDGPLVKDVCQALLQDTAGASEMKERGKGCG